MRCRLVVLFLGWWDGYGDGDGGRMLGGVGIWIVCSPFLFLFFVGFVGLLLVWLFIFGLIRYCLVLVGFCMLNRLMKNSEKF